MKECEVISKMKTYAVQAIQFIADIDFSEFSNDVKTINACVFNLSQIGELVTKLDEKFIRDNNHIPLRGYSPAYRLGSAYRVSARINCKP